MAMNRMARIVLDPIRTYACTRTARTGVRVTLRMSEQLQFDYSAIMNINTEETIM